MADKIIASISYIRTVSNKKATIEKILAHLSKSEICDKTWSTESLKELLSDMTAKDQIELADSGYKIKQNEAQDDNDFDNNCSFVKNTQIDCTSSVSDDLTANLETVVIPEIQQTPLLLPICQLLLDSQLNRYKMTTAKVLFISKTCF